MHTGCGPCTTAHPHLLTKCRAFPSCCNRCGQCCLTLTVTWLQQILDDHTILRSEVLPTGDNGVNLPVNLKRLIWNAQQLFKIKPNRKAPSGALGLGAWPLVCCC